MPKVLNLELLLPYAILASALDLIFNYPQKQKVMKNIKYNVLLSTLLVFLFTGCKKDFLDVNENPNYPENVAIQFLLPSAQASLAYTLGNQLHVVGGLWSQYWTQGPNANQYNDLDRYFYNNSEADRPWRQLYSMTLKDLDEVYKKGEAEDKANYSAIALILRAYTLQLITDAWGDVPFTEALQGNSGIEAPKFDTQESIYDALIPMIDSALARIDFNTDAHPANDDLIYQGDMVLWYKFANTLKLKVYLRQSKVRPGVAAAGIGAMAADPTEYLESGEDALTLFIDEKFRQNPLFTTVTALSPAKNIFASETSVDYLNSINDPRVADFYDPNAIGNYVGIPQGAARDVTLFPPPVNDNNYSMYNSEQIIAADVPVRLMSAAESMFLQAEAIARGYMTGDAAVLYEAGIEDSWSQWTNSSAALGTDLTTYLAQPEVAYPGGGGEAAVEAIITQKWIAMNGNQNFEAWTEWRRTGYPDFFVESVTSELGSGVFPARLLYPSDELTTNPNVITGRSVTDRVWWDIN
jgi:hypothetical protein